MLHRRGQPVSLLLGCFSSASRIPPNSIGQYVATHCVVAAQVSLAVTPHERLPAPFPQTDGRVMTTRFSVCDHWVTGAPVCQWCRRTCRLVTLFLAWARPVLLASADGAHARADTPVTIGHEGGREQAKSCWPPRAAAQLKPARSGAQTHPPRPARVASCSFHPRDSDAFPISRGANVPVGRGWCMSILDRRYGPPRPGARACWRCQTGLFLHAPVAAFSF